MQMRGLPILLKNSSLADFTQPCFRVGPSSSLLELDAFLSCFPEKDLGSNSHLLDAWPWAKEGPLNFSRHLYWGLRTPCELVTWQCFPRQETETRDFTRWPVDRAFKNTESQWEWYSFLGSPHCPSEGQKQYLFGSRLSFSFPNTCLFPFLTENRPRVQTMIRLDPDNTALSSLYFLSWSPSIYGKWSWLSTYSRTTTLPVNYSLSNNESQCERKLSGVAV